MTDIAIRVENLSKLYRIGVERHDTLRDAAANFLPRIARIGTKGKDKIREIHDNSWQKESEFWALRDVSFEVQRGEVVGVIGRNGAGKSTLLKILSRITEPTTGFVELHGRVGSLLEVGTGFHPELTGRENIYLNGAILGMKRTEIALKFDEIVAFSEIEKFLDTPVKRYSSGMYVRLAFAVAAHLEPEILLVDEVLAVGDAAFQKKCLGKMGDIAGEGRTVLFVSHNMAAVQELCNTAILLKDGSILKLGATDVVVNQYLRGSTALSVRHFEGKPLRKASIIQQGGELHLLVDYDLDRPIDYPCLGFVISDHLGRPICGSNPRVDNVPRLDLPRAQGSVQAIIANPKLLNGYYQLSLWFGDGFSDFFEERDCISFEVVNMFRGKQLSPLFTGAVKPTCRWIFM